MLHFYSSTLLYVIKIPKPVSVQQLRNVSSAAHCCHLSAKSLVLAALLLLLTTAIFVQLFNIFNLI